MDIALGLPLLWAAIRGIRKGFILEVTGLAALFLGAYAALYFSDFAAAWLDERFAIGHAYLGITAFALTFVTVAIGVHLLGRVVEKMVDITALKPLRSTRRLGVRHRAGLALLVGRGPPRPRHAGHRLAAGSVGGGQPPVAGFGRHGALSLAPHRPLDSRSLIRCATPKPSSMPSQRTDALPCLG